jgi:hypothetical protein
MAETNHQNFYYDGQIRRFVQQFIRMVSNFYVEFGSDTPAGATAIQRVPVMYGDSSRQAQSILQNNSENTMPSVPAMSVYITDLVYDQGRMQEPFHVNKISLRQHRFDNDTNAYNESEFDSYTVERPMPVPYELTLSLDIWTSSTEQKLQLLEQIATLFNPSLEIQSTENYIDWTSISAVRLTNTRWDSRTVPMNGNNDISISTMTFSLPIWISPPSRVKRLGVILSAVSSVYDSTGAIRRDVIDDASYLSRRIVEPYGFSIIYAGDKISLLKNEAVSSGPTGDLTISNGNESNWASLIDHYGTLQPGLTEIRLTDIGRTYEMTLFVNFNPANTGQLLVTSTDSDSFPANTVDGGIDAIIDPFNNNLIDLMYDSSDVYSPGQGRPVARNGTNVRYLTLGDIGSGINTESADAWGGGANRNFIAKANDIIEYDISDNTWRVVFDASTQNDVQYVTNLNTNTQYKWHNNEWTKSIEGLYREGEWRLVL